VFLHAQRPARAEEAQLSIVVEINQRARTAEQKELRRQAVLDAAEAYFHEVGYEAFSMAKLAQKSGVVKGTLYLYFKTREELFLTLYERSLARWSRVFVGYLSNPLTSKEYAEALYSTAVADGTFVPLLIRLEHVIEHNVAVDRLIRSKRAFIHQVEELADLTSIALGLGEGPAQEIVKTMGVLLIGATRSDQGPSLDGEALPDDVENLVASFSSRPLFVKNAVRIIEGIRAESVEGPA
jgi:AcrR family transcriptional regulator